jgi:hypothetical protein
MRDLLSFPNPVNEKAARSVAFVVMSVCIAGLASAGYWLFIPLAYGFVARVLSGPRLSPLGRLASSVIAPRLGPPQYVPGPPKRFAQAIGAVFCTTGAVAAVGLGAHAVGDGLFAMMILAAGLESLAAVCIGCRLFALLMRAGVIPERVCAECADISARTSRARA